MRKGYSFPSCQTFVQDEKVYSLGMKRGLMGGEQDVYRIITFENSKWAVYK